MATEEQLGLGRLRNSKYDHQTCGCRNRTPTLSHVLRPIPHHALRRPQLRLTFAVSIVGHLDLQAGQACVAVQLAVVAVGLCVAPAHRALVRLALLRTTWRKNKHVPRLAPGAPQKPVALFSMFRCPFLTPDSNPVK